MSDFTPENKLNLNTGPNRGGFAVKFDDKKRHTPGLNKLQTCQRGTDEYFRWMSLFVSPENDTVDYIVEDDGITYTFYNLFNLNKKEKV